ncbi:MAG: sigma-70 family RNA polymerase sigma factor [Planctomycetota bacterium]
MRETPQVLEELAPVDPAIDESFGGCALACSVDLEREAADLGVDPSPVVRAQELLRSLGLQTPEERYQALGRNRPLDALQTCLMDAYRQTRSAEVFALLEEIGRPALLRRIRGRLRTLGIAAEARDVLQDALVNVFRYPDKFDGTQPGAFKAWVAMIIDNVIRRSLRVRRSALDLQLLPQEILSNETDRPGDDPALRAERGEECRQAQAGLRLLLIAYLQAYAELSERERTVLREVEVGGKRYSELSEVMGSRPEALKMVVFRARRRIEGRIASWLAGSERAAVDHAA